ncbi:MAG: hypothetical protein GX465_03190 [Acidobacteria bacterium]|nr:hypothetical protein [Acidobacteriota bacterium]
MSSLRIRVALVLALAAVSLTGIALMSGEPITVKSGAVVLPITGLAIELPADTRDGFTWSLASSYALSNNGTVFDGRDVIDEKIKDKLVAGCWVQVGYFNAGDCRATVAQAELADAWSEERDLFGIHWCLRGGTFEFDGDLGKVPAVVMCAHRDGRKDLLIYRFFIDMPLGTARETLVAALAKAPVVERAALAWQQDAWAAVKPRHRPEVRDRGDVAPVRTVKLAKSGLTLALPDDGFVWLVRAPGEEDAVDWLEIMAPAMNEANIEIMRIPGMTCQEVFDGITTEKRYDAPPSNVPTGWTAGPTLVVDGKWERVVGRSVGGSAILVGLFNVPDQGRGAGDFAKLAPMLEAIAKAAEAL